MSDNEPHGSEAYRLLHGDPHAHEPKMTRAEAIAEAVRRWGNDGTVDITPEGRFVVGYRPSLWLVRKGSGDSWEAAFADAARRAHA